MKKIILMIIFTVFIVSNLAYSKDMREVSILAEKEFQETLKRQKETKNKIFKDKTTLTLQINNLKAKNAASKAEYKRLQKGIEELKALNEKLMEEESKSKSNMDELAGSVRVFAKELEIILKKSVNTAFDKKRPSLVQPVLDKKRFPGIDDIKLMANLFLEETDFSGHVFIKKGNYINNNGGVETTDILTIGGFTSFYENGFLGYSDKTNNFYTLSKEPSYFVRKNLKNYFNGDSDDVYVDISGGGAFAKIAHSQTAFEKVKKGGILAWPILAIGLIAIIIGIERFLFLRKVHRNTDVVMGKVNELAASGNWEECERIVGKSVNVPVYNVLRAGLNARKEERETMESILQESILKELPKLDRFLPFLNILGAIAPLIGLLGTVTGMINTFQVITVYGTGDPRMMSGGISTALVTTMLGLTVAIPIMLLHTSLSRRVEYVIGDMEEKAIALTNIILRDRSLG